MAFFGMGGSARNGIKSKGHDEFFVSVNKYNANALAFYVKMGGRIISVDEDGEDRAEAEITLHYEVT